MNNNNNDDDDDDDNNNNNNNKRFLVRLPIGKHTVHDNEQTIQYKTRGNW